MLIEGEVENFESVWSNKLNIFFFSFQLGSIIFNQDFIQILNRRRANNFKISFYNFVRRKQVVRLVFVYKKEI